MEDTFEFEHEIAPASEDDDTDYVTKTYRVHWDVEPGQRGGWEDPSWEAYPYVEYVTDTEGNKVTDPAVLKAADDAVVGFYESAKADAAESAAVDAYEDRRSRDW